MWPMAHLHLLPRLQRRPCLHQQRKDITYILDNPLLTPANLLCLISNNKFRKTKGQYECFTWTGDQNPRPLQSNLRLGTKELSSRKLTKQVRCNSLLQNSISFRTGPDRNSTSFHPITTPWNAFLKTSLKLSKDCQNIKPKLVDQA